MILLFIAHPNALKCYREGFIFSHSSYCNRNCN